VTEFKYKSWGHNSLVLTHSSHSSFPQSALRTAFTFMHTSAVYVSNFTAHG